ncbi:MAG TPA: pilus assembly protein TadG-related protein [Candidatus Dormibacteraeota bacterium]
MLIALTLLVLFGMLGLAIDGGRAYIDRRELQNAVDAAVLVGGDQYQRLSDLNVANNSAATYYGLNEHISNYGSYNTAAAVCPNTFPAGSTCNTFTWSGYPGSFTFGYLVNQFNGTIFSGSATHQVAVTFMQVLGVPSINNYSAIAEAVVGDQWQTPALLTLGQQGCNGNSGDSLKIQGSVSVTITGDVYSNGDLRDQNGAPVTVNGSIYADCSSLPAGWTYTGTLKVPGAPVLPDPAYNSPYQSSLYSANSTTAVPTSSVEMTPGVYPNDPGFTNSSGCHFFDPGIYTFPSGYTDNGGFNSNELRSPIEPLWNGSSIDYTQPAGIQFWSQGVDCDGDFYATAVTATGGKPLKPGGAWGIEITAVRQDTWNGPNGTGTYVRQSAPSMCRKLETAMNASTHGFQVVIGNVPGAQGYYVYGNPSGCPANNQAGFGFMGFVANNITESNSGSNCGDRTKLPGYPNTPPAPGAGNTATGGQTYGTCNLGYAVSEIFDNNNANPQGLGYVGFNSNGNTQWAPVPPQCVIAPLNAGWPYLPTPQGCNPPDSEQAPAGSGLANEVPVRAITPNGDRGNENQCRPQGTLNNPCAGAQVTPGAVQFYFPPNACINQQGNGSTYIFSGYQYNWIVLFAPGNTSPPSPPTPNSCSGNTLTGNSTTTFLGTIYFPTGSITINGSNKAPVAGQVIVYNALIDGSAGVAINYNPAVAPAPPAARLIV